MADTFKKLSTFVQESKNELRKVNWPSREETIRYTIFVIVISIALSLFLGAWDAIFLRIVKFLIS